MNLLAFIISGSKPETIAVPGRKIPFAPLPGADDVIPFAEKEPKTCEGHRIQNGLTKSRQKDTFMTAST
jgi:hypothetical protein